MATASTFGQLGRGVRRGAEHMEGRARPWVVALARAGFACRAVLYTVIGALAAVAAVGGDGGATTGPKGALATLHEQAAGKAIVVLMIVGLIGYALWRFVQGVKDPEHEASRTHGKAARAKGYAKRFGWILSGVAHLGLVAYAVGLLTGHAIGKGDDEAPKSWTARVMATPYGPWLVGAVGVVLVAVAAKQIHRAWRAELDDQLDLSRTSALTSRAVVVLGRFGIAAYGVIGVVVGSGLVFAATHADPRRARGFGDALRAVQSWSFGWLALVVVAIGLVAYGLFEACEARWRRIGV